MPAPEDPLPPAAAQADGPGAAPRRLRVAMLSLHTSPLAQPGSGDAGGMNVYVRELSAALRAEGHAVDIFTRAVDTDGTVELDDGVVVHHIDAGPRGVLPKERLPEHLPEAATAIDACCAGRFDLIHSHYWMSGLAGLELAGRWSVPLVHTMHTMGRVKSRDDAAAEEPGNRLEAETLLAASATRLTANTRTEASELVDLYGAAAERIDVVPPGADLRVFRPAGAARWLDGGPEPGAGPNPNGRPLRLLFAGRIQRLKGPQILVRALGVLRERGGPPVELAVLGSRSGAATLDLAGLAREHGVGDAVHVLPPVPARELAAWFRGADAVAVPSYSESFGLVALEAQACGTPVLAHNVGGLRHAVADGRTGRLVSGTDPSLWADALAALAADAGLRAAWGAAAAEHARGFSWQRTAGRAAASYLRALG